MARRLAAALVALGFACLTFGCAPSQPTPVEPPTAPPTPATVELEPSANEPQVDYALVKPLLPVALPADDARPTPAAFATTIRPLLPVASGSVDNAQPMPAKIDRESQVLIDECVKALGGKENVAKCKCMSIKKTLETTLEPGTSDTASLTAYSSFSKCRIERVWPKTNDKRVDLDNGKDVWLKLDDDPATLVTISSECNVRHVASWVSRMRWTMAFADEANVVVSAVPPITLHAVQCPGFKATQSDLNAEAYFYFHPDSHLVIKVDHFLSTHLCTQEIFEYKEYGGVLVAQRSDCHEEGMFLYIETVQAVKFHDKLDPKLFERPE